MEALYIAVANVHNPGNPGDHQKQRIGGKIINLLKSSHKPLCDNDITSQNFAYQIQG